MPVQYPDYGGTTNVFSTMAAMQRMQQADDEAARKREKDRQDLHFKRQKESRKREKDRQDLHFKRQKESRARRAEQRAIAEAKRKDEKLRLDREAAARNAETNAFNRKKAQQELRDLQRGEDVQRKKDYAAKLAYGLDMEPGGLSKTEDTLPRRPTGFSFSDTEYTRYLRELGLPDEAVKFSDSSVKNAQTTSKSLRLIVDMLGAVKDQRTLTAAHKLADQSGVGWAIPKKWNAQSKANIEHLRSQFDELDVIEDADKNPYLLNKRTQEITPIEEPAAGNALASPGQQGVPPGSVNLGGRVHVPVDDDGNLWHGNPYAKPAPVPAQASAEPPSAPTAPQNALAAPSPEDEARRAQRAARAREVYNIGGAGAAREQALAKRSMGRERIQSEAQQFASLSDQDKVDWWVKNQAVLARLNRVLHQQLRGEAMAASQRLATQRKAGRNILAPQPRAPRAQM